MNESSRRRPRPPKRVARGARPKSTTPVWTPPWRKGLPARPKEDPVGADANAPQPLGAVLDGLFEAKGVWIAGLAGGDLGRRWSEVVGEPLDRETAPGALGEDGVLTVRAASPAWATQLRFLSSTIAANANQVLGREAVREVRVVVDRRLTGAGPMTDPRSAPGPPATPSEGSSDAGSGL